MEKGVVKLVVFNGEDFSYWENRTPRCFCVDAISTTCYISNRIFSHSILHLIPFELCFGLKPFVTHYIPFGCKCFVLRHGNLDKFESRFSDGIFSAILLMLDLIESLTLRLTPLLSHAM
jgi:hypothetical protein